MIHAIVLINVTRGQIDPVARTLMDLPGVSEVYSIAGRFDLVVILRVKQHEALSSLVAVDIQKCPGVESTETLIAFRAYSRHDLEALFGSGAR